MHDNWQEALTIVIFFLRRYYGNPKQRTCKLRNNLNIENSYHGCHPLWYMMDVIAQKLGYVWISRGW